MQDRAWIFLSVTLILVSGLVSAPILDADTRQKHHIEKSAGYPNKSADSKRQTMIWIRGPVINENTDEEPRQKVNNISVPPNPR